MFFCYKLTGSETPKRSTASKEWKELERALEIEKTKKLKRLDYVEGAREGGRVERADEIEEVDRL